MRRVLRFPDLQAKGVCGSRTTLHRLRHDDPDFPKPVVIGGGIGFFEDEVDQWLSALPRRNSITKQMAEVA